MAGVVAPIDRICVYCGGEITLPENNTGVRRKYCSIVCSTRANAKPLRRVCPECGDRMACRGCGWTPN